MDAERLKRQVIETLRGIDEREVDDEHGWWETSAGADFGADRLRAVLELIDREALP